MSGVRLPTFTSIPRVDGLSTDPRNLGRHIFDSSNLKQSDNVIYPFLLLFHQHKDKVVTYLEKIVRLTRNKNTVARGRATREKK